MHNIVNPVVVATAAFVAIFFTDLFRHNYKPLVANALFGFFCILVVSVLCKSNMYGIAWLLVFSPLIVIVGSIAIKNYREAVTAAKTLPPVVPPKNVYEPAPYFL